MNHSIVPLSQANLKETQAVLQAVFPTEPDAQHYFELSLRPKRKGASYFEYFVLVVDGKVIGTTGLYRERSTPKDLWLGWYGVLPEYRGQGWGSVLLDFSVQKSKEMGAENLRLWTTDEPDMAKAALVYAKKGFTLDSKEWDDESKYNIITYGLAL